MLGFVKAKVNSMLINSKVNLDSDQRFAKQCAWQKEEQANIRVNYAF